MPQDRFSGRLALSARIREAVLAHILNGELKPGDRLVEMRLAEKFGTSQAPVREALRELEMAGLVETSRNRGTRVKVTTLAELIEIYDVRAELEAYAGGVAARVLTKRLGDLRACVDAMVAHAARSDLIGFGEANARFHMLIVEAAGNATLLELWKQLDVRSRTTVNIIRSSADLQTTALSHQPIIDAIESGRAGAIKRELRNHIVKFKPNKMDADKTGLLADAEAGVVAG